MPSCQAWILNLLILHIQKSALINGPFLTIVASCGCSRSEKQEGKIVESHCQSFHSPDMCVKLMECGSAFLWKAMNRATGMKTS